jgi:mono/diheme cytochrome c family protein
VLVAITNGGKVAVLVLAGLLIVFAILSAFYFPRRNPNFPGDRLGLFIFVTILLFLGSMGGIIFFAKEEEEAHGAEATETQTTGGETTPPPPAGGGASGDAAAGKTVFASAGCAGCHTLEAAGATGTVGPNLDEAKPDEALVVERVTNGKAPMPSFKGQLDEQQIQDVAAFVVESTR